MRRVRVFVPLACVACLAWIGCGSSESGVGSSETEPVGGHGGASGGGRDASGDAAFGSAGTGGDGGAGGASGDAGDGGGAGGSAGGDGGGVRPATQANGLFFPPDAAWNQDVSSAKVAADSEAITSWMVGASAPNGWGTGEMRIDFSLVAVEAPPNQTKRSFQISPDFYYEPDCDEAPVPVVPGGIGEGTTLDFSGPFTGYRCDRFDDGADCHMLFLAPSENRLYEIYHGQIDESDRFTAGCLAIWDTSKYDVDGRGQQCTSADAAGLPMSALLFTVEEIQRGSIDHAIRFILPNTMIRERTYVSPGTHGTKTTGPATSIPYAGRMRLKASYPIETLSPSARIVAKAMQKYGMIMSDGGQLALTAQSDALSSVKWAELGIDSRSLEALKATDFDVLDYGATTPVTNDCRRTPLTR